MIYLPSELRTYPRDRKQEFVVIQKKEDEGFKTGMLGDAGEPVR